MLEDLPGLRRRGLVFQYSRGSSGGCCSFGVGGGRKGFFWSIESAPRVSLFTSAAFLNLTPLYYSLVGREGGLPECEHFRAGSVFSYLVDARTYLECWVGEFEEWRKIKMKWGLLVGEYVVFASSCRRSRHHPVYLPFFGSAVQQSKMSARRHISMGNNQAQLYRRYPCQV